MRDLTSLLNGRRVAAGSGPPRAIHFPFDGTVVARVWAATPESVEAAIDTAWRARPAMQSMSAAARADILERLAQSMEKDRDTLAHLLVEEAGKPITSARTEADRAVQTVRNAAYWARQPLTESMALEGSPAGVGRHGILKRFPVGVVAAITPFNFPLNLVAHKLAPAVAAGCPVILKPASQTPAVALHLAELLIEAGLPPSALHVLLLPGAEAERLVTDERIAMITFTGSAVVGWGIKSRCGRKKVTLELGGNAAAIVEPDANLNEAVGRLTTGAFAYAGQSCISVQRIYVHDSIAANFTEALMAAAKNLPAGDPRDERTMCGPLIDTANADRVEAWIAAAQGRGARVLCGNQRNGNVISPTVVVDAPEDAELCCEEAFGPVVSIHRYREFEAALALVNQSRYGLQAGIYTQDVRKIWRAFETLEVGGVIHNDGPTWRVDAMPYGGVKDSGFGREGPRWAIEEMTEPRLLVLSTGTP